LTWSIVAGSGVGLLASTMGRLYSSTYYVLRDTRTPLLFAAARVALTTALGLLMAIWIPRWLGLDAKWGAAGLTASAGIAAWVEFTLLRRTLNRRIGATGLPASLAALLWTGAGIAALVAWGAKLALPQNRPLTSGALIVAVYGIVYFAATAAFKIPESLQMIGRARRMLSRA
jgi:putative peptidoglycan lipid II flippase